MAINWDKAKQSAIAQDNKAYGTSYVNKVTLKPVIDWDKAKASAQEYDAKAIKPQLTKTQQTKLAMPFTQKPTQDLVNF
jgi:hypothetical protein